MRSSPLEAHAPVTAFALAPGHLLEEYPPAGPEARYSILGVVVEGGTAKYVVVADDGLPMVLEPDPQHDYQFFAPCGDPRD